MRLRRPRRRAVFAGEFLPYAEAWAHAERLEGVLDALERALNEGHASAVVALVERFVAGLDEQLDAVDDSDGAAGEALRRAEELHARACRTARPSPEVLAERLLAFELDSAHDVFWDALERYADVLGDRHRALSGAGRGAVGPGAGAHGPGRRLTALRRALSHHPRHGGPGPPRRRRGSDRGDQGARPERRLGLPPDRRGAAGGRT